MSFQSVINYDFGFGIPGTIVRDGPIRAHTGIINSTVASNNVFGRVFTLNSDNVTVGAGGTGEIWGILANPKEYASFGGSNGPLSPSFALPNNTVGDFVEMGKLVVALYGTVDAAPGLGLQFSQANGQISIPKVQGTADTGCTLLPNTFVEDFSQSTESGSLILVKTNL